jgi:SNF family Na+-dependent transporter
MLNACAESLALTNWVGACPGDSSAEGFDWSTWPYSCRHKMTRPEEFFKVDVLRYYDPKTCEAYKDGDASTFSPLAAISAGIVWLACFLSIFDGVKSSSWIVWFTVPVPFLFIIVMLFKGLTLDGSGEGINQYIFGDEAARADIDTGKMWADAIG